MLCFREVQFLMLLYAGIREKTRGTDFGENII